MGLAERLDTALIHEAAARLAEDRTARPGLADTRRAIRLCLLSRADVGALERDDIERTTVDAIERRWARQGWLQFRSVEGWADELRSIATFYESGGRL